MDGRDGLGRRALVALVAALALAIVPAACGDDDEDDSGSEEAASAETVTVTTSDTEDGYTWDVSPTPTADTQSVTFENESEEPHALIFARLGEGYTVDEAYELQGRKGSAITVAESDRQTSPGPGETTEIEVTEPIEPGEYAIICPIAGQDGPHYKLGQLEEFSIE
jgi:plastocyanin